MDIRATLRHVLTSGYIFDFTNMLPSSGDRLYMIAGLLMVLLGAVFKLISNFSRNSVTRLLWHRLASPLVVGGILEVLWYTARDQNIKMFGSHFIAWLIGIVVIVWIYFPIRYCFGYYRQEREHWQKQQVKLKYIK